MELVEQMEKEDEELKSDIEALNMENTSLKSLLEKAEKEVEIEKAQVEALFEEMANLTEKNVSVFSSPTIKRKSFWDSNDLHSVKPKQIQF